jgi:hypothetical protein
MIAEGEAIPEPSTPEQVLANPEWSDLGAAPNGCLDARHPA